MANIPTTTESTPEDSFIAHLDKLRKNPHRGTASMAALRRGLGKPPGSAAEMHRYVVPLLGNVNSWGADARYLVASLYAYWHQGRPDPVATTTGNLGASLSTLVSQKEDPGSIEKRFEALLNCHVDDLPQHLRHTVGLLRGKDIPVNWTGLLHDICGWDFESRSVQRNWAKGFWGKRTVTPPPEDTSESTTDE